MGDGGMSGFVYFIQAEPVEAVKIGYSRYHPRERMRALQLGCPTPLKLTAFIEGSMKDEDALHRAFAHLRIHTEWFRLEGELAHLLAQLRHSRPTEVPGHKPIVDLFVAQMLAREEDKDFEFRHFQMAIARGAGQ